MKGNVAADVAREDDVDRYVAAAVERFGRLDLHHLNAGIPGTLAPLPEISAGYMTGEVVSVDGGATATNALRPSGGAGAWDPASLG
jgi:NADP-dependent 3-hydroxy acid dehydrogenase YdfG